MIFDPLHYLALLEQKPNALDQAAPLAGWILPEGFPQLQRLMEARLGKKGKREFVQTLRLLETFPLQEVATRDRRCPAAGRDLLRCGQASAAVPDRAAAGAAGSGKLSTFAGGASRHHCGRRLSDASERRGLLIWTRRRSCSIII